MTEIVKEIFKLDELSWGIIRTIAKDGPSTKYYLEKELPKTRPAIYLRFEGSENIVGLEKNGYVKLLETNVPDGINSPVRNIRKKRKNLTRKYYGLTFKGFLASLGEVELNEIYLFEQFINSLRKDGIPQNLLNLLVGYIKTELEFWFKTHFENGLNLTYLKNSAFYYRKTKDPEKIFGTVDDGIKYKLSPESHDPKLDIKELDKVEHEYSDSWIDLAGKKRDYPSYMHEKFPDYKDEIDAVVKNWVHQLFE